MLLSLLKTYKNCYINNVGVKLTMTINGIHNPVRTDPGAVPGTSTKIDEREKPRGFIVFRYFGGGEIGSTYNKKYVFVRYGLHRYRADGNKCQ